jgi:hypothetical protein
LTRRVGFHFIDGPRRVRGPLRFDHKSPNEVDDDGNGDNTTDDASRDGPCTGAAAAFVDIPIVAPAACRGVVLCAKRLGALRAVDGHGKLTDLARRARGAFELRAVVASNTIAAVSSVEAEVTEDC